MDKLLCTADVVIIGAGIAGASVARQLAKFELDVVVIEKNADVCFGATKGSHGIVHCGIPGNDHTPLRNRGEIKGNLMMEQLCRELDVPYSRIGKLLVAFDERELKFLINTEISAKRNGVIDIELITDKNRIKKLEPNISDEVVAALYTRNTGVTTPWSLVIGLIENAVNNGVKLFLNNEVQQITSTRDDYFIIRTNVGFFKTRFIINAAGINADKIAAMTGDTDFTITGTRQQRIVMDKHNEGIVTRLVRSLNQEGGVGDFVCPTVHGNVLVGSMVEDVKIVGDTKTTREGLEDWVIPKYLRLVPGLSPTDTIKPFAGFIPNATGNAATGDYWIKSDPGHPKFINMVLGGSGFTAAPAMAEYIVLEMLPDAGLKLMVKRDFDPIRKDISHFNDMSNEERAKLISSDPRYGHIICRCETVSEGEIVEAIKRGATTRDGVKFRTRAGMGRCQGGFCGPRILKILSRELNKPVEEITRKGQGSVEVLYKTKELLEQ